MECYAFYSDGTVELRHGGTSTVSDSGSYQGDDTFVLGRIGMRQAVGDGLITWRRSWDGRGELYVERSRSAWSQALVVPIT
jgi:hypothetical protein